MKRGKNTTPRVPRPLLSQKKLWTITLLFPIVLVFTVEGALRILHLSPDLSLFTTMEIAGTKYFVMNPDVKMRYFSKVDFSPATSMDAFTMPKPANTFRIFCLGGSTTVGFPYGYQGSFPTFLKERLSALFPEWKIEVINLGMTATNSFTTLDIGRELFRYAPDLIVVYDGHNEFYGALGVASRESVAKPRWVVELYLSLLHWRTFVALRDLSVWIGSMLHPSSDLDEGTMMERLAIGKEVERWSPDYLTALHSFEANLRELATMCREHNVPIVFGTQVSDLRDLPPFVPGSSARLPPSSRTQVEALYARSRALAEEHRFLSAISPLDSALALDSTRADIYYLRGRMLDSLHRYGDAERTYALARDFDRLRFRTSSDFNNAIMALDSPPRVMTIDLEQDFRRYCPDSLIGRTLILEHLHPTAPGAFLMAKFYAESIRNSGLIAPGAVWEQRDTIADTTLWKRRSLTDLDLLAAAKRISSLTSRWPFRSPFKVDAGPESNDAALNLIADRMISGELSWERGHVEAAEHFAGKGDLPNAEKEYRAVSNQIPYSASPFLRLGEICVALKDYRNATAAFERALAIEPTYGAARTAGSLHAIEKDYPGAMQLFQQAARLASTNAQVAEIRQLIEVTERHLQN